MTEQPGNLRLLSHPLIQHKLSILRDRDTPTMLFRQLLKEISLLMGYEVTRDLPLTTCPIQTPLTAMDAPRIAGRKVAVVSVLRAGLGMAAGLLELMPAAREGHIGLYRDEATKRPVEYLVRLPEAEGRLFVLVDPMLATGHSALHALTVLNRHGVADADIRLLVLVAAPPGVALLTAHHPSIPIFAAALDQGLNDNAFIVPGLGDAGDRLFGTKER
jgi:uracil phosphoribosyltransferase